jgi:hypothetical protein
MTASRVLPVAIASEPATCPETTVLTRKAPRKIVGQLWRPSRRSAAIATPDAGHTGEALGCRWASDRPSRPAA